MKLGSEELLSIGRFAKLNRLMKEVMAANGLREAGDPREVYVSDPAKVVDPAAYETRIVWPVGPEGELGTASDRFERGAG